MDLLMIMIGVVCIFIVVLKVVTEIIEEACGFCWGIRYAIARKLSRTVEKWQSFLKTI